MSIDDAMALATRLLAQAQALAAVTAYNELLASGDPDAPATRPHLEKVVDAAGARDLIDALSTHERVVFTSFVRSYMRQALSIIEQPAAPGAWTHDDPAILQAQGSASGVVAQLLRRFELGRDDARILDVGTGVAGLAIAFCRTYPNATVVGIDPWEPALELARANVAAAGLDRRITLLPARVEELDDTVGFDLIWLPSFFIPEPALDPALTRLRRAARPDATIVVGTGVPAGGDPLLAAVDDFITVRSGGTVLSADDAARRLERAGFAPTRIIAVDGAPISFAVGTAT